MNRIPLACVLCIITVWCTTLYAVPSNSPLIDFLGEGDYPSRKEVIIKLGDQFVAATSQERENILNTLHAILENESDTHKKTDALLLLGSLAYTNLSRDETLQVEEILDKTVEREQDTAVILLAARVLPDFGAQDKSIAVLSSILSRKELLKQEPKLITVTLLSLGRMGEPAIPRLVNAINDFPEKAMMALAATREQKALQLLSELRKSANPEYRIHSVKALALWRASKDVSPNEKRILDRVLSAATHDKNESVRGAALEKLRELKE